MRSALALLCTVVLFTGCGTPRGEKLVIGSKNFTEQIILAELLAQHIETKTGVKVERRHNLGGTLIAHRAVTAGEIDLYVEYTGTALTAVLNEKPSTDSRDVLARVRAGYAQKFSLEVLDPLGFNNTFAIVVRGDDAQKFKLRTISDLMRSGQKWRAGFGYEFKDRPDGFDGMVKTYGLQFAEAPRFMELGLLYRALQENQVDVVAGSATDGVIAALGMVVLEDDRHYFPPYEAAPIVNRKTLERFPQLRAALASLAEKISEEEMRRMNYAVDGEHRDPVQVAREFLASKKL
ncbi:MAG: ABC transporter substrate-binding protein [Acidobacteria bacterium]|nr:ABC transporter substrate-binding protein [Acidobacteriota bacterium]